MKHYIGDGVYIKTAGTAGDLQMTTEDGVHVQNSIYLESEVIQALFQFIELAWNVTITVEKK